MFSSDVLLHLLAMHLTPPEMRMLEHASKTIRVDKSDRLACITATKRRFEVSEGVYDVYAVSGNIRVTTFSRQHEGISYCSWQHEGISYESSRGDYFRPSDFINVSNLHDYISSVSQMCARDVAVEDARMRFTWVLDGTLSVCLEGGRIH
jgi:hypothetical protein